MGSKDTKYLNDKSSDFLLKEFDRLHALRLDTTRQLEARVGFFLTISTAGIGGVVVISQIDTISVESFSVISVLILIILLVYGILILNRAVARNSRLANIRLLLFEIQKYFGRHDPEVLEYLELEKRLFPHSRHKSRLITFLRFFLGGGIQVLIIVSNSLISAAILIMVELANLSSSASILPTGLITFGISLILFTSYYSIVTKFHKTFE